MDKHRLELYVKAGLYLNQIAMIEEMAACSVARWLKEHGLKVRDGRHSPRKTIPCPEADELSSYAQRKMTYRQIAKLKGVSHDTVKGWFSKRGILLGIPRGISTRMKERKKRLEQYAHDGLNVSQIAEREQARDFTVRAWLRKLGIEIAPSTPMHRTEAYRERLAQYIKEGQTYRSICEAEGYSEQALKRHLRYYGLKTKKSDKVERFKKASEAIDLNRVREMIEQGHGLQPIAKEFGVSRYCMKNLCDKEGLQDAPTLHKKWMERFDNREVLNQLVEQEMTIGRMAIHMNSSRETVQRLLMKHNLKARGKSERAGQHDSVPCKHLVACLKEVGLVFELEYLPIEGRKYRIDIAFPTVKLGLEVNGNFHYVDPTTEKLAAYYRHRHEAITEVGWELIEIHYKKVWNETYVKELIETIRARLAAVPCAASA